MEDNKRTFRSSSLELANTHFHGVIMSGINIAKIKNHFLDLLNKVHTPDNKATPSIAELIDSFNKLEERLIQPNIGNQKNLLEAYNKFLSKLHEAYQNKRLSLESIFRFRVKAKIEKKYFKFRIKQFSNNLSKLIQNENQLKRLLTKLADTQMKIWDPVAYNSLNLVLEQLVIIAEIKNSVQKLTQIKSIEEDDFTYEKELDHLYHLLNQAGFKGKLFKNDSINQLIDLARQLLDKYQDAITRNINYIKRRLKDSPSTYPKHIHDLLSNQLTYQWMMTMPLSQQELTHALQLNVENGFNIVRAQLSGKAGLVDYQSDIYDLLMAFSRMIKASYNTQIFNHATIKTILENFIEYMDDDSLIDDGPYYNLPQELRAIIKSWIKKYLPKDFSQQHRFVGKMADGLCQLLIAFEKNDGQLKEDLQDYSVGLGLIYLALSGYNQSIAPSLKLMKVSDLQQKPNRLFLMASLSSILPCTVFLKEIVKSLNESELAICFNYLIESDAGRTKLNLIFDLLSSKQIEDLTKILDSKPLHYLLNYYLSGRLKQNSLGTNQSLACLALNEYLKVLNNLTMSCPHEKDPLSLLYGFFARSTVGEQLTQAGDKSNSFITTLCSTEISINPINAQYIGNLLLSILQNPHCYLRLEYSRMNALFSTLSRVAQTQQWVGPDAQPDFVRKLVVMIKKLFKTQADEITEGVVNQLSLTEMVVLNLCLTLIEINEDSQVYSQSARKSVAIQICHYLDQSSFHVLDDGNPFVKIARNPLFGSVVINLILNECSIEELNKLHKKTKNIILENIGPNLTRNDLHKLMLVYKTDELLKIIRRKKNINLLVELSNHIDHKTNLLKTNNLNKIIKSWPFELIEEVLTKNLSPNLSGLLLSCNDVIKKIKQASKLIHYLRLLDLKMDIKIAIRIFKAILSVDLNAANIIFLQLFKERNYSELRGEEEVFRNFLKSYQLIDYAKLMTAEKSNSNHYLIYLLFSNPIHVTDLQKKAFVLEDYINRFIDHRIYQFKGAELAKIHGHIQFEILKSDSSFVSLNYLNSEQLIGLSSNLDKKQLYTILKKYLTLLNRNSDECSNLLQTFMFTKLAELVPHLEAKKLKSILISFMAIHKHNPTPVSDECLITILNQPKSLEVIRELGCMNDILNTSFLERLKAEQIEKIHRDFRFLLFKQPNVTFLDAINRNRELLSLDQLRALMHDFKETEIDYFINQINDESSEENRMIDENKMLSLSVLFCANPKLFFNSMHKLKPIQCKKVAFSLLEEVEQGRWSKQKKYLEKSFLQGCNKGSRTLSDHLVSNALSLNLSYLDNISLATSRNSFFVDYIVSKWNLILKNNSLFTIQALLRNKYIVTRLNDKQLENTSQKLAESEFKPEDYSNLLNDLASTDSLTRFKLIRLLPIYIKNLNETHFSYVYPKPILQLIQQHVTTSVDCPSKSLDSATSLYNLVKSNKKKATIVNAIFQHQPLKHQLLFSNQLSHQVLMRERLKRINSRRLGIDIYSLADLNQRIAYAYHVSNNIDAIQKRNQAELTKIVKPIIKLNQSSWYNFFNRWYYGREEKKNREFFIKIINSSNEKSKQYSENEINIKPNSTDVNSSLAVIKSLSNLNTKLRSPIVTHAINPTSSVLERENSLSFFAKRLKSPVTGTGSPIIFSHKIC